MWPFPFKISVGATSVIPPTELDNLWIDEEPISMTIDLDNIDDSIASLEAKIGAVEKCPKGVSADHLSKIWSIDTDTAKQTIDITTHLCKHGEIVSSVQMIGCYTIRELKPTSSWIRFTSPKLELQAGRTSICSYLYLIQVSCMSYQ